MEKIAYIRISTKEQFEDRQVKMMRDKGIKDRFIFIDKQSGKDFDRPAYKAMLAILREGDTLYIENIDRLGRTFDGILKEWEKIRAMGVHIVALDNQELFDSLKFQQMGEIGKLLESQMLSIFAYVAEQERTKMLKRQKEGIAAARERGQHMGRPSIINEDTENRWRYFAKKWSNGEIKAVDAIRQLKCGKTTWYKYLKENGIEKVEV